MRRLVTAIGVPQVVCLVALLIVAPEGWSDRLFGLMLAVTLAVGWLLAARLPRNPLGWLLLAVSGAFLLAVPAHVFGVALATSHPAIARWLLWYAPVSVDDWVWLPPVGLLFTQVLLRFPDGRLPSPRWRPFSVVTLAVIAAGTTMLAMMGETVAPGLANPTAVPWVRAQEAWLVPALGIPLLLGFAGSAASVVVRYRRAGAVERTQIRWFAWAASIVVGLYIASFFIPGDGLSAVVGASYYSLIPASIGVAVLRYRLYEIDRIISRTASYALVTVAVVGVYAGVVTSVTRVVPASSSLAVAAATLAAAAVFRPVLRRVRAVVDRRFDRERYDAQRVVETFGARLRNETDADVVVADLLGVVQRTVGPREVGLWVRR